MTHKIAIIRHTLDGVITADFDTPEHARAIATTSVVNNEVAHALNEHVGAHPDLHDGFMRTLQEASSSALSTPLDASGAVLRLPVFSNAHGYHSVVLVIGPKETVNAFIEQYLAF